MALPARELRPRDLMDTGITTTVLGSCAAASSTIAFVPQILKIWKTGGKDVSYLMLSLYAAGVTLWLFYGLMIGATALRSKNPRPIAGKRLRIAIDMDETIADALKEHIRRYNARFTETITADNLYGKHLEEFAPFDRSEATRNMVKDGSFFDCLDVMKEAQEVIHDLASRHEVFIVSAAMEIPESFAAKHRWLQRHFPFIPTTNVVFRGDKGIVQADYLIDDEPRHFCNFSGAEILFSAPHNSAETAYERVSSWYEIRQKFLGLRNGPETEIGEGFLQPAVQDSIEDAVSPRRQSGCTSDPERKQGAGTV